MSEHPEPVGSLHANLQEVSFDVPREQETNDNARLIDFHEIRKLLSDEHIVPMDEQKDTIEKRREQLTVRFRKFIKGVTIDFSSWDLNQDEDFQFYKDTSDVTLTELNYILQRNLSYKFSNKHTVLFFDLHTETSLQRGASLIKINMNQIGWMYELRQALKIMTKLSETEADFDHDDSEDDI